jgi:hypothetical protein
MIKYKKIKFIMYVHTKKSLLYLTSHFILVYMYALFSSDRSCRRKQKKGQQQDDRWAFRVVNSSHSHDPTPPETHPALRRMAAAGEFGTGGGVGAWRMVRRQ